MKKNDIKVLYDTDYITSRSACHYSKVIEYKGIKFKIYLDCTNGHSHLYIYGMDGVSWQLVASHADIIVKGMPFKMPDYIDDEPLKHNKMKVSYDLALRWIVAVY